MYTNYYALLLGIVLYLFTPALNKVNAQTFEYEQLSLKNGLSNSKVTCILQDKKGFMWFGTYDGLNRYDGYKFLVFRHNAKNPKSLTDNLITTLFEDRDGFIWIGTKWGGLSRYDCNTGEFESWKHNPNDSNSLSTNYITCINEDKQGKLWIGTYLNGLIIFDKKKTFLRIPEGKHPGMLNNGRIKAIYKGPDGIMWIGTGNGGLNRAGYVNKTYTFEAFSDNSLLARPLFSGSVLSICKGKNSMLWLGCSNGIGLFNPENGQCKSWKDLIKSSSNYNSPKKVWSVFESKTGKIWVGTSLGLELFDPNTGTFRQIIDQSNSNSGITSIFEDKSGVIWIGTLGKGIYKWQKNSEVFVNIVYKSDKSKSLSHPLVRSVFQDNEKHLWVGTENGINEYDSNNNKIFEYPTAEIRQASRIPFRISAINEDHNGNILFFVNRRGMFSINKITKAVKNHELAPNSDSRSPKYVRALFKDNQGSYWLGSELGLSEYKFRSKEHKYWPIQDKNQIFKNVSVSTIITDKSGNFWIGTDNGLFIFDKKTHLSRILQHNPKDSNTIVNDQVRALLEDKNGFIWIGTREGVNRLDPKTGEIRHFNELPGISVFGILEDAKGLIWLSTPDGLYSFAPQKSVLRQYRSEHFEAGAIFQNSNGDFFIGGQDGLIAFNPNDIRSNDNIPPVVVTNIKILDKVILRNGNLSKLIEIELGPKDYFFSVEFAALDYTNPEKNQYAYMFEGINDNWISLGNKHEAIFSNLNPGKYTLKIKGSNSDEVWNDAGVSLNIVVLPPWWKTWWFKTICALVLVSSAIGFFYYRTQILRRQKRNLELMVQERTRNIEIQNDLLEKQKERLEEQNIQITSQRDQLVELNEKIKKDSQLRLSFFTNVSHEFRTPLTLIQGPVDKILSVWKKNDEIGNLLLLVKRNSNRLCRLVDELMDFRSIETKSDTLKLSRCNIVKFTSDVAIMFNDLAIQRSIKYKIYLESEVIEVFFDFNKLEKIIYNLISNAFKYTKNDGEIEVYTGKCQYPAHHWDLEDFTIGDPLIGCEYFEVRVKDNGIGIDQDNLELIFSDFYREPLAESTSIGSGIGLALTKELVLLHKGMITVKSRKYSGSTFIVRIPVNYHLPKENDPVPDMVYDLAYSKNQVNNFIEDIKAIKAPALQINALEKRHLLIIEDNTDLRNFMIQQFSDYYRITEASNGTEGLNFAVTVKPDLIVSDVMMPEMDGMELCNRLKNDLKTSHIPILLLTARSDAESQIQGLEIGADDYVSKPFDINILLARISNLIQSREQLRKLFSISREISAKSFTSNPQDEKFLQRALDIVKENMSDINFGAKELVDKMCVSRSLLHQKLVSLTNQSAIDFITTIRLNESVNLMEKKELTIMEISMMVGFSDPYYFSRCFKKHFGKSPKAFAEELRNKTQRISGSSIALNP